MADPEEPLGTGMLADLAEAQRQMDAVRARWEMQMLQNIARPMPLPEPNRWTMPPQRQRLDPGPMFIRDNMTWTGIDVGTFAGFGQQTPQRPAMTGGLMITLLPEKDEITETELAAVRGWIKDQATGKKKNWPGYTLTLRVNGKGRIVQAGVWECPEGSNNLFLGNGNGVPTPIWAPSALMSIARYYRIEEDTELVRLIHEMLATVIAKEIVPVMTDLAAGYNGRPVTEIAVNKKERIFVGRYPEADGVEGPFRHLTGEIAEINDTDWVKLKL